MCSHIAAIISCIIRASELQSRSGTSACTSQKCSWLPTTRDVSYFNKLYKKFTRNLMFKVEPADIGELIFLYEDKHQN